MKKIKVSALGILLAMMLLALTACSRNDTMENSTSATDSQTTTQTTTPGTTDSSMYESSTGVIGGMMDDVQNGVNDVMDGTERATEVIEETTR